MFNAVFYFLIGILLILSFIKDRQKTKMSLIKAWKSFENILPLFLSILFIIGIMLAVLSPQIISEIMGAQSGWLGIGLAAIIGSITVIPGFVTFPLAATLLKNGAGLTQIIVFISTSVMVGVVTIPIEIKYLGRKVTYLRNFLALIFSFVIAFVMGGLMNG